MGRPKVSKRTLLKRIKSLSPRGRSVDIDPKVLFDKRIWIDKKTNHVKREFYDVPEDEPQQTEWAYYRAPCTYYGLRGSFIERLKASKRTYFTEKQLVRLFDSADAYTLGDFAPVGTPNDFFMKMNRWYYGSFGTKAFSTMGEVPSGFSHDPFIQQANASLLHEKARKGQFGKRGEIVVQKWGFGGILESVTGFLDHIKKLDKDYGTKIYKRLRYEASDLSKKSVQRCRQEARKSEHRKAGVLHFKVSDITKPVRGNPACIESSYLLDSISQPILGKIDGVFYEAHFRSYFDLSILKDHCPAGLDTVIADHFMKLLETDDYEGIAKMNPKLFSNMTWEQKLKKIDITDFPHGRAIAELTKDIDTAYFPAATISSICLCIENRQPI